MCVQALLANVCTNFARKCFTIYKLVSESERNRTFEDDDRLDEQATRWLRPEKRTDSCWRRRLVWRAAFLSAWVRGCVSELFASKACTVTERERERERERDRNWQRKREKEREIFCFERACIDCQRKREKERESQQNLDSKFNETWTIFANKDLDNICKQSLDSRPLTLCVNICWQNLESLYLLGKHLFNR